MHEAIAKQRGKSQLRNLGPPAKVVKDSRCPTLSIKRAEMLAYRIAITFTYHNFVQLHISLGGRGRATRTPAMAGDIVNCQWTISDLVNLADEWEAC